MSVILKENHITTRKVVHSARLMIVDSCFYLISEFRGIRDQVGDSSESGFGELEL